MLEVGLSFYQAEKKIETNIKIEINLKVRVPFTGWDKRDGSHFFSRQEDDELRLPESDL